MLSSNCEIYYSITYTITITSIADPQENYVCNCVSDLQWTWFQIIDMSDPLSVEDVLSTYDCFQVSSSEESPAGWKWHLVNCYYPVNCTNQLKSIKCDTFIHSWVWPFQRLILYENLRVILKTSNKHVRMWFDSIWSSPWLSTDSTTYWGIKRKVWSGWIVI